MSYKQNCYLSPSEKEIINTLMPANFTGNMREIIAKCDETNYLYKLQNANTGVTCHYEDAHTVSVVTGPWVFDTIKFYKMLTALAAGNSVEAMDCSIEPEPILINPITQTLTADITLSGAGGLDTGAEAANTWYYVYLIGKSTSPTSANMLLSVQPYSSGVTLPTGYDLAVRVGMVRNNVASNFIAFDEKQVFNVREYWFLPYQEILHEGTSAAWAQIVPDLLPSNNVNVLGTFLRVSVDTGFTGEIGSATGNAFLNIAGAGAGQFHYNNEYLPNIIDTNNIWYRKTDMNPAVSMDVFVNGFKYSNYVG